MKYFAYILAAFSLVLGLTLAFKPVIASPIDNLRIKGVDKHDENIHIAFFTFSLFILFPIWQRFLAYLLEFGKFGFILMLPMGLLVIVLSTLILEFLMVWIVKRIISKEVKDRRSIRLFCCENCNKNLERSNSLVDFLNEKEQITSRIGSITFEAWYCRQCCTEVSRNFIHLRSYINESTNFHLCRDCDEITMTRTSSEVIKEATTTNTGEQLVIYTCQYCNRTEEKIEIIPREQESGGGGGDGGDGGDGGG